MKALRRTAVPVALAVGGLLVVSACDVNETTYTGNASGKTVAVIGDDQTSTIQTDLHTAMDVFYQSRNISSDGKTMAQMQDTATTLAADNPQAVVIDLGTNDAKSGVAASDTLAQLDTMIAKFPSSCIVVVDLNEQATATPSYSVSTAHAYNEGLLSRHVTIADWNGTLMGNLADFTSAPDQLIPAGDGKPALANTITASVTQCFNPGGA
jgi:hypothetical protein